MFNSLIRGPDICRSNSTVFKLADFSMNRCFMNKVVRVIKCFEKGSCTIQFIGIIRIIRVVRFIRAIRVIKIIRVIGAIRVMRVIRVIKVNWSY